MPRGRGGCGFRRRWGHGMRVVEPMMLLLLAEEPAHGYRLAERLTEVFDIASLPAQTVYRALQAMEEQGWILSEWDMEGAQGPPRKVFQITEAGVARTGCLVGRNRSFARDAQYIHREVPALSGITVIPDDFW